VAAEVDLRTRPATNHHRASGGGSMVFGARELL
jgi:hypothetical protein